MPAQTVTASGTVVAGAEAVLLATVGYSTTTGRIHVAYSANATLGPILIGTNGLRLRLRVNGLIIAGTQRTTQITATLAVAVTNDSDYLGCSIDVLGLPAGPTTIEVLMTKQGGAGTASVTGDRSLSVHDLNP